MINKYYIVPYCLTWYIVNFIKIDSYKLLIKIDKKIYNKWFCKYDIACTYSKDGVETKMLLINLLFHDIDMFLFYSTVKLKLYS